MSVPPSEDLLVQRQLRAAEVALETARRRRFEIDEAMRVLRADAARAEAELARCEADRERDAEAFRRQISAARAQTAQADQRLVGERNQRLALEQQLSALRGELGLRDDVARQSAAEARIRQLEGELELVSRRAAEFEYGVRMAAGDAFKRLGEVTDHVDQLLRSGTFENRPSGGAPVEAPPPGGVAVERVPSSGAGPVEPRQKSRRRPFEFGASRRREPPPSSPQPAGSPATALPDDAAPVPVPDPDAAEPPPVVASGVDPELNSQRLDAALHRLRASAPPPEEPA